MRAYFYDNLPGNPSLPHDCIPSRPVSAEALKKLNIEYWHIPVQGYEPKINEIANLRGYKNRDAIHICRENFGDLYEAKIQTFLKEHLHEDEEIRYILSGGGFFDVREPTSDEWIRLAVEPGDLIVIPAGIYHRFTVNEANNCKALRLFQDEPKWIPYNRSTETDLNPYRVKYLTHVGLEPDLLCKELGQRSLGQLVIN